MNNQWQTDTDYNIATIEPIISDWLFYRKSMTARLKACCHDAFVVDVVQHQWAAPTQGDCDYLNIEPGSQVIDRVVVLYCDGQPWMYARTVIPQGTVNEVGDDLIELGSRPIGEILFADSAMKRSAFEIIQLTRADELFEQSVAQTKVSEPNLWARRSIFSLPNKGPLAITEVFMPVCWQSATIQN